MGGRSLVDCASAFAAECEQLATIDELSRGVCALVASFGYPNVASGRIGRSGAPDTFHFANWDPKWLEFYMRKDFLRIDPVPLWAVRSGRPLGRRNCARFCRATILPTRSLNMAGVSEWAAVISCRSALLTIRSAR